MSASNFVNLISAWRLLCNAHPTRRVNFSMVITGPSKRTQQTRPVGSSMDARVGGFSAKVNSFTVGKFIKKVSWQTGVQVMNPSQPFILRPVATSLLMAGILIAGFVAYKQLPVSALPQVEYPTIQVLTFYPGASGCNLLWGHRATRAAIRTGSGLAPDDLDEFVGRIACDPPI